MVTTASTPPDYDFLAHRKSAVFFTSTWCDWYLEQSRPSISQNCRRANGMMDELARAFPDVVWQGVVSRLWTGEKDLREYREKYDLSIPVSIDTTNKAFIRFGVKNYPTLILFENGNEVERIEVFDSKNSVMKQVELFK